MPSVFSVFFVKADASKSIAWEAPFVRSAKAFFSGWFLTGEMMELIHSGVNNIVCTQPFGCLPNHVVGKGVIACFVSCFTLFPTGFFVASFSMEAVIPSKAFFSIFIDRPVKNCTKQKRQEEKQQPSQRKKK